MVHETQEFFDQGGDGGLSASKSDWIEKEGSEGILKGG